jgi:hypothetical protein
MSLATAVTVFSESAIRKGGMGIIEYSTLRALMVLPTWPLASWFGWPTVGAVGGIGMSVPVLVVALIGWSRGGGTMSTNAGRSAPESRGAETR